MGKEGGGYLWNISSSQWISIQDNSSREWSHNLVQTSGRKCPRWFILGQAGPSCQLRSPGMVVNVLYVTIVNVQHYTRHQIWHAIWHSMLWRNLKKKRIKKSSFLLVFNLKQAVWINLLYWMILQTGMRKNYRIWFLHTSGIPSLAK